jgi:hypothetical protein
MKLSEIKKLLNMVPAPYRWLDDERCVFACGETRYGIFATVMQLETTEHRYTIANISFGVIGPQFESENDLDTTLTGTGLQRTVFSTVADACINNKTIVGCDILCLGAADEVKDKRSLLYSLATSEIQQKVKQFSRANSLRVVTSNGTYIAILSKVQLSPEEQEFVMDKLNVVKA